MPTQPPFWQLAKTSPAQELDQARCREDFPLTVKTWDTMNIREREAFKLAELRRQAGL